MGAVRELTERLIEIPGVVSVTLRGSRAGGAIHPDTDRDFALYYREAIRADDVRALGFQGTVVEPDAWGRLVNGGGWLTVEDQRVNLRYRDLDVVRHPSWTTSAARASPRSTTSCGSAPSVTTSPSSAARSTWRIARQIPAAVGDVDGPDAHSRAGPPLCCLCGFAVATMVPMFHGRVSSLPAATGGER